MTASGWSAVGLAVYFMIGMIEGYVTLTRTFRDVFDEELDETDEDDRELLDARDALYDSLHTMEKLIGHRGMILTVMLLYILGWLPIRITLAVQRLRRCLRGEDAQ